jgi:hypothetical protein
MLEALNTATELASLASKTQPLKSGLTGDSATRTPDGATD